MHSGRPEKTPSKKIFPSRRPGGITEQEALLLNKMVPSRRVDSMLKHEKIQKAIELKKITPSQVSKLSLAKFNMLLNERIFMMICKYDTLTVEQMRTLTEKQYKAFSNEYIFDMIHINQVLSTEKVLTLTDLQIDILSNRWIFDLICKGYWPTVDKALELSYSAFHRIASAELHNLIQAGKITLDQMMTLTDAEFYTLKREKINSMICIYKTLTVDQALLLTTPQINLLEISIIFEMINTNRTMTVEQALGLTVEQALQARHTPNIFALIYNYKALTAEQVANLSYDQQETLNNKQIFNMIVAKAPFLDLQQALELTPADRKLITNTFIQDIIKFHRVMDVRQVLNLSSFQHETLTTPAIYRIIFTDCLIEFQQALSLTHAQRSALQTPHILEMIAQHHVLLIELLLQLTDLQCNILKSPNIFSMICINRSITLERALTLNETQLKVLERPGIHRLIHQNVITLEEVLSLSIKECVLLERGILISEINNNQSTHFFSVHVSTAESAEKLWRMYGLEILTDNDLENKISDIKSYMAGLPDDRLENRSAKKCIANIIQEGSNFVEQTSCLTIKQLLALFFLAIHSKERIGTFQDALKAFVEALYEIQRGGNLSDTFIDNNDSTDYPICWSGAFNKLIEKLQSIHPDCTILLQTPGVAAIKLQVVVRDEARQYLKNIQMVPGGIQLFNDFVREMKITQDVEPIWEHIKDAVAARMRSEFQELYRGNVSNESIVDGGQYTEFSNFDDIEVISQNLSQLGLFSSNSNQLPDVLPEESTSTPQKTMGL